MNAPQPQPDNPFNPAAADPVLEAGGEAIGAMQAHLASLVDPALAAGQQIVQKTKALLGKAATRAVNHQQTLADTIVGGLGQLAGTALASGATALQTIGHAAAQGKLNVPPAVQPQGGDAPNGYILCINCANGQWTLVDTSFATAADGLTELRNEGWTVDVATFATSQHADGNAEDTAMEYIADHCGGQQITVYNDRPYSYSLPKKIRPPQPHQPQPTAPAAPPQPSDTGGDVPVPSPENTPLEDGSERWQAAVVCGTLTPFPIQIKQGDNPLPWGLNGGLIVLQAAPFATESAARDYAIAHPTPPGQWECAPPPVNGGAPVPPVPAENIPATAPPQPCTPLSPVIIPAESAGGFPQFPVLKCTQLINGRLPPVGSEQWCQCIDAVSEWLDQIGNWAVSAVMPDALSSPLSPLIDALSGVSNSLLPSVLPVDVLTQSVNKQAHALDQFYAATTKASAQFALVAGPKLIGLSMCRTLLDLFKSLEFGWDIAIWATVELQLTLKPIEKLLDYIESYSFQYEIPSVGEAIDCYLQHTAPVSQVFCWMKMHGANPDIYAPVIEARREKLQDAELIQWLRRNDATDEEQKQALIDQGWIRDDEAAARVELYDELPTISDHLHWLQRNVFDDEYVKDFDLLNGFDTRFWPKFGHDLRALGMKEEYAQLHYAAHWINPSLGQLAEMKMRLRPGRVDPSIQFTSDDYLRVLQEQDVAPYFRKRLEAISYRTIPLRQLNQAAQQGRFDEYELSHRWQDIGFTLADSQMLAKTTMVQAARQVESQIHGYTASFVSQLAERGLIDQTGAEYHLLIQGYTEDQVRRLMQAANDRRVLADRKKHDESEINKYATLALKAYEDGIVDATLTANALKSAGFSRNAADQALITVDLRLQMSITDGAVKAIRKAYLRGELTDEQASLALVTGGILQGRTQSYIARWQLEKTPHRVALSTGKLLSMVKKGIVSVANAAERLKNLGWNDTDINLQLMEIEQEITHAKSLATSRNARMLVQAQAAADRAKLASQKQLCKIYTTGRMIRWYAYRIIDEQQFRTRFQQCGRTPGEIDGLFKEASVARDHKDKQAEKKGATGVEYVGPGKVAGGPNP